MKSPQSKHIRLLQEKYQENLEVMFKNLLKDESLSDVTIYCKDGAVRGHKVILAACSSYFKKIFHEHPEPQVVFMVHGVSIKHMKSLIELMYRGSTDVSPELMSKLCEIAEDFGVKGIIDENERTLTSAGRDTRYRGQKRVAVDFESLESQMKSSSLRSVKNGLERRLSSCSDKSSRKSVENIYTSTSTTSSPSSTMGATDITTPLLAQVKLEPQSPSVSSGHSSVQLSAEARRRHNWAMKQRKYTCGLCPASFKRASHLTRHQLVHTGERPFTCDQCDKAFSRHDKLKHHIRKAHESHSDDLLDPLDLYTIGRVEILTPRMELSEDPDRVTREDLMPRTSLPAKLPKIEPEATSTPNPRYLLPRPAQSAPPPVVDPLPAVPQKKGRGRPRKHPPTPRPLIKRPRGRPRLNPAAPRPLIKRPRGRPRLNQSAPTPQPANTSTPLKTEPENYDITNMPFGDLEYLTKPLTMRENTEQFEDSSSAMEPNLMEPLVEIQMDQTDQQEKPEQIIHHTAGSFLQNIGLLENTALANIGECTISLSSSSSS